MVDPPSVLILDDRFSTNSGIGKSDKARISLRSDGDLERINSCLCFKISSSPSLTSDFTKSSVFKLAGKVAYISAFLNLLGGGVGPVDMASPEKLSGVRKKIHKF